MWNGKELFKMIHQLRPDIIINDRCGVPGDYFTPEQKIGGFNNTRNWESCMTLTGFWSWHGFQTPVISYETCLKYLISCAGGDGNLLMNVGPMPTGQIDPREENRILKVGKWLEKNGESIYGTCGGPFMPDSTIVSTYKGNQIFVFAMNLKNEGFNLPGLKGNILKAETLSGSEIKYVQTKDQISVALPKKLQEDIVTVIKLTLEKNVNEEQIPVKMKSEVPHKNIIK